MEEYIEIIKFIYKDVDEQTLNFGIQFAKVVLIVMGCIIGMIIIIYMWKIFKKAGEKSWKAVIPIYNLILLYKISGISPLFLISLVLLVIPQTSLIGFFVLSIIDATQKGLLAKKFDKSTGFIIGIILFDFIFYPILAFGKSKYNNG